MIDLVLEALFALVRLLVGALVDGVFELMVTLPGSALLRVLGVPSGQGAGREIGAGILFWIAVGMLGYLAFTLW